MENKMKTGSKTESGRGMMPECPMWEQADLRRIVTEAHLDGIAEIMGKWAERLETDECGGVMRNPSELFRDFVELQRLVLAFANARGCGIMLDETKC